MKLYANMKTKYCENFTKQHRWFAGKACDVIPEIKYKILNRRNFRLWNLNN